VLGSRGAETGVILFAKVFINNQSALYMTDYWKAYSEFIPSGLHVRSKAQTYTVEGFNSLLRHYLARLRRKTKCYTKSAMMLYYSLRLLFAKRNNELSILF
jgi:insertion element IS1 protein InsB